LAWNDFWLVAILLSTLRMATPMIFASMGGLLSERSGVVNVALEGFMLVGAFAGAVVAHSTASAWMGWAAALFFGLLIGMAYSFFVIQLKADQIVTGTAFNLGIAGIIPFFSKLLFDSTGSTPPIAIGDRFNWEPTVMAALFVAGLTYVFYNSRAGLWLRFAGEHPKALNSSGVSVAKVRWVSVSLSGAVAALGGATLSLALASSYSPLMSGGRGFMALAALIFGRWLPAPAMLACLFFGFTDAIQIRLQGVHIAGVEIPVQFIQILPYVVTIIAVSGFFGGSKAPLALGKKNEV